jgi:hypothetical protein
MRRGASIGALAVLFTLASSTPVQAQDEGCTGGYVALCPSLTVNLLPILDGAAFAIDRLCVLPGSCPG